MDGDLENELQQAGADSQLAETGDSWEAEIQEMLDDSS